MDKLLQALYDITYKDVGDFGGWHGLRDYCLDVYGDNVEVLMLVAFIDRQMQGV
jgi:hypothetical protein